MNRKGFLLASTVVKIVIAVICIVFLVYLLSSVYFSRVNAQKKAEALNTLTSNNKIGDEIKRVHSGGQFNPDGISLFVPKGWYLFSFTGNREKPNSCAGVNCVCICDNMLFGYFIKTEYERQMEECDENGACIRTPELTNYKEDLELEVGPDKFVLVKKIQGGFVEITEK